MNESVIKGLDFLRSDGWEFDSEKDGIRLSVKPSPFCNKKASFIEVYVTGADIHTLKAVMTDDPDGTNKQSYRYKFDTLLERFEVTRTPEGEVIHHGYYRSPVWGIAPRDSVTLMYEGRFISRSEQEQLGLVPQGMEGNPNSEVFLFACLDAEGAPQPEEGFVRTVIHRFVMYAQQEENRVKIVQALSADPSGSLPAWMADIGVSEQVKKITLIRDLMVSLGPMKS